MGRQKAKDFLKEYRRLKERERQTEVLLDVLRGRLLNCSPQLDGMPKVNGKSDKMAEMVAVIADTEKELENICIECIDAMLEIQKVIDRVEDKEQSEILNRRYICGEHLLDIAYHMEYSYRWTTELHRRALMEVQKILDNYDNAF